MLIAGCGILIALYSKELQYRKKYVNRKLQMSELNYWVEFFTSYSFDHYLGHYFYTKKVKTQ